MKQTGLIRPLDKLGRIVIPKDLRRKFALNEGSQVEFLVDVDSIIIRKYKYSGCQICGCNSEIVEEQGIKLCKKCLTKMMKKESTNEN